MKSSQEAERMGLVGVNTCGVTRFVILTRRYAIKIPRFWWYGRPRWKALLWGLLANMQEKAFSDAEWPELCPVVLYVPGGFLNVMPRCQMCNRELSDEEYRALTERADGSRVPAENKSDSFGYLHGRLVAVDYGS